jgi:hypothetical protein
MLLFNLRIFELVVMRMLTFVGQGGLTVEFGEGNEDGYHDVARISCICVSKNLICYRICYITHW